MLDSGGFNLFDDGFDRGGRSLVGNILFNGLDLSVLPRQGEALDQGECICPAGEEPSVEGGPSSEAFESIFLENIEPLVEGGGSTLSIVDNPVNIVEVSLLVAVHCVCYAVEMEEPETKPLHKCFLVHNTRVNLCFAMEKSGSLGLLFMLTWGLIPLLCPLNLRTPWR